MMIGAITINGIVTTTINYGLDRDRPFSMYSDIVKLTGGGGSFFPSGHASLASNLATSVGRAYPKIVRNCTFFLMVFSCFMGTFYLGFLLTVVLVVALIADMTILPVLLMLFYKMKK